MASTIVNHFFVIKNKTFIWFRPYDCDQNPQACGPNTDQIMYGETSNVSISNSNIKCPTGISIFAVHMFRGGVFTYGSNGYVRTRPPK